MTALTQVGEWTTGHPFVTVGSASALAVAAGLLALRRMRAIHTSAERRKLSAGTLAAVLAFVVCTSVSLNTSYRFTADGLGMTGAVERLLSCAAFESLMAMCVLGAREHMDGDTKSPGWYGSAVWVLAALSSVPAWHEGGGLTTGTVVRVIVGSFGSALAAHSALGLELRHRTGAESQSPMAQIARDLRERLMARLGLAHRGRTAQEIAQARALSKAVDLADQYDRLHKGKKKATRLAKRLARWQDRAGIATDEYQRKLYRDRVALRRFATQLEISEAESPWHTGGPAFEPAVCVVAEWEERIRHVEDLAADAEAAVAAQVAGASGSGDAAPGQRVEPAADRKAAAVRQGQPQRITARLPQQQSDGEHQDHREREPNPPLPALRSHTTKRAALEDLYARRIEADDSRSTNAITEQLLGELAAGGITLDRGAAHRYVADLRTQAHDEDQPAAQSGAVQGELVSA